jgi:hypothetical protein
MINLLECLPSANDATSLYRGRLPLLRLQKQFSDQLMIYPYHKGPVTWDNILLYDMVFIQRPCDSHHFEVMKAAKRHKLPVWIDYDDLLCNIPTGNLAGNGYGPAAVKMIGNLIDLADIITVSTNALKFHLGKKYGNKRKMKVIPNALDLEMFRTKPKFRNSKNILWRGSHTHMQDLLEYKDPIIEVMNKNDKWSIDFMGYNPFFITNELKNSTYTHPFPIDEYIRKLSIFNYSICIVPLDDCPFNRSKSNIAWQETTYAGAVCLAPDWEEWQKPGIVNYTDQNDFKKKLKAMISGKYDLKRMHQQSWQYISENLSLAKVNKLRSELIMH